MMASSYVLHPPFLSVYYDDNNTGVANRSRSARHRNQQRKTRRRRGADHTTNGIRLGIDGWIYIAMGDFGCVKATGKDGTELQFHGGGILRVRPDGSGLEVYCQGTAQHLRRRDRSAHERLHPRQHQRRRRLERPPRLRRAHRKLRLPQPVHAFPRRIHRLPGRLRRRIALRLALPRRTGNPRRRSTPSNGATARSTTIPSLPAARISKSPGHSKNSWISPAAPTSTSTATASSTQPPGPAADSITAGRMSDMSFASRQEFQVARHSPICARRRTMRLLAHAHIEEPHTPAGHAARDSASRKQAGVSKRGLSQVDQLRSAAPRSRGGDFHAEAAHVQTMRMRILIESPQKAGSPRIRLACFDR